MSFKSFSVGIVSFQFYGVVTRQSCLSISWTIALNVLAVFTWWSAFDLGILSSMKMQTVLGMTYFCAYFILLGTRSLVWISSLVNVQNVEVILDKIELIDKLIVKQFKLNINTKKKFIEQSLKILAIVIISLSFLITNFKAISTESDRSFWFLSLISIHVLHIKEMSFVFLIDLLNHRLKALIDVTSVSGFKNNQKVLKVHTQLFLLSKLINDMNGNVITLITFQHCFGLIVNFFWLFLALTNLEFSGTYGEWNF